MNSACSIILTASLIFPSVILPAVPKKQDKNARPAAQQAQASPPLVKEPLAFGLEDGTPIKLRISRTISSADAQLNETVDFEVLEEVKFHDVVIVSRGAMAWGTVTEAQPKRRMGRGGKLNVNIDNVRLVSGEKIALRAIKDVKGGGHQGAITGAIVATSIIFFPAAPLFLLVHGKDITIPKGTEITAYVNGDAPLEAARFVSPATNKAETGSGMQMASNVDSALSTVDIISTPDGAEITIDDKYKGSTPAVLKLTPGDHKIRLEKSGFKFWEKTLSLTSAENTKVNASLEKE